MSKILLALFSPFLFHHNDHKEKSSTPESPVHYHEKMDEILPDFSVDFPFYMLPFTPSREYFEALKKDSVYEIRCDNYEPPSGGYGGKDFFRLDTAGHLIQYILYDDAAEKEYWKKKEYEYDKQGRLVHKKIYYLEDGISKQYRGFTEHVTSTYNYSADNKTCEYSNESDVVSIVPNRKENKYWDGNWNSEAKSTFDSLNRVIHISGNYFDLNAEVDFQYDNNGNFSKRIVQFTKSEEGFVDSIAYRSDENILRAEHYFGWRKKGKKIHFELLEINEYDYKHRLIASRIAPGAEFPDAFLRDTRGVSYSAVYKGDTLSEENEFDVAGKYFTRRLYSHFDSLDYHIVKCRVFCADSSGHLDTLQVNTTFIDNSGLIQKVDVRDNEHVYFKGSWYTPEFSELNEHVQIYFKYAFRKTEN